MNERGGIEKEDKRSVLMVREDTAPKAFLYIFTEKPHFNVLEA